MQAALKAVRDDDPGNLEALFLQLKFAHQYCGQLSTTLASGQLDRSVRERLRADYETWLGRTELLANELLAASGVDETRREEAESVLSQVRQAH